MVAGADEVDRYLRLVDASQSALAAALPDLTDADVAGPSLLPGWTRAHLLTHVARNGEALAAMMRGAVRGEVVPQYGGSQELRDGQIEAGAARTARELAADVAATSADFMLAARAMTPASWGMTLRWLVRELPAPFALEARWREVEVHRLDLDLGYRPADWPQEFVQANLARELGRLPRRAPGVDPPAGVPDAEVLAWLFGRPTRDDLPPLPAWG